MTSFAAPLRYAVEDGIAMIAFDRPEVRNAFDQTMAESLLAALRTAEKDERVRVVIVTGRGESFSAGQDIRELYTKEGQGGSQAAGDELRRRFNPILLRIRAMEQPVIAAINGVATGAGLGIALACDFRIAAERASFICAPHGIALIPAAGVSWLLPRLVGFGAASELAVLGERIGARQALELGLVHRVVPDDQLVGAAREFAETLASRPASSLSLTKRALNRSFFAGFEDHLAYEADLQEVAATHEEHAVRLRAMAERSVKPT